MAVDITHDCRAIILFALKREAEPLVWRFGLYPFWDETRKVFCIRTALWDTAEPPEVKSDDVVFAFTGVGPERAAAEVRQVLTQFPKPGVVISAGIAGGLHEGHGIGHVVVPLEVASDAGRWQCAAIGCPQNGRLYTSPVLVTSIEMKRELRSRTGADVVDMEAAAIAETCATAGVPFAAVKAVCDPFDFSLPQELPRIAPHGQPRYSRIIVAVLRRPRLVGELHQLNRNSRLATWALCERIRDIFQLIPDVAPDCERRH